MNAREKSIMFGVIKNLILVVGVLFGAMPSHAQWTHRFEYLDLEQAKKVARDRIRLPDESTRVVKDGWNPFDSPNGDPYREIGVSRSVTQSYIQKSYSNLSDNLRNPNNAAFINVRLLPVQNDQYKFFCRMDNIGFLVVDSCQVVGITGPHNYIENQVRQYPMEHAFYCEVVYGINFNNCLFEDLGGHGVYIAYRPRPFQQYGAQNKPFDRKPRYRIKNVSLIDTEQDASRGSHSITFFDPGNADFPGDILIEDTCVINGWDFERYQGNNERYEISDHPDRVRSCGPIVITNFEEFPEEGWPTDTLTLRRVVFWQVKAKHSMGDIRNIREVLIEDCFFRAEDHMNPVINLGSKDGDARFKAPEKVTIRNCKSDGVILRIWKDDETYEDIDLNTEGREFVWTL